MALRKLLVTRADGRTCTFYMLDGGLPAVVATADGPVSPASEMELRWNPLLDEWTVHAAHRQDRTFLPSDDGCPLCPSRPGRPATEIPAADFDIAAFDNRFPTFRKDAPFPPRAGEGLLRSSPAEGAAEVIVYTPRHDATLANLPQRRIRGLIEVWADRYEELGRRPGVAYVFIFENKGREIGVTLTHPHGQVYAYPFIPPRVAREIESARRHQRETGGCLFCDLQEAETADGRRVVAANEAFVAYVPFAARLPYEVHVVSRRHRPSLPALGPADRDDLAAMLKVVLTKYDSLWGTSMPYVMSVHQAPTDGRDHPGSHFHIEFTPPYRTPDKLKYLAGSETGAGTFINDTFPEGTAEELRCAEPRTTV